MFGNPKPQPCGLAVSGLCFSWMWKRVISPSHTLLGHTDKLFFKNKEGKQSNKREKPCELDR